MLNSQFRFGFNVKETTTASTDSVPTDLQFLGVGHSYVKGTVGGLGTANNSYRREMYYRWRTHYGMEYTFVGSVEGGDIPTPYHNGVDGEDSAGVNDNIDTYLDDAFAIPTSSDCVLLGPIGFADCLNEVPLATFNANLHSIVDKIHAHSPLIKIFLVTDPWCPYSFPEGQDIDDYADEVRTVYTEALAQGHNVYLIDLNTPNTETIHIPAPEDPAGGDNIHPDWLGYEQMGELITDSIATSLNIPSRSLTTILIDTFTDTDSTLLKNHTSDTNDTGDVWHDANDRFEINTNQVHGVGGYAFDTYIDINSVVYTAQIKMYQSVNGSVFFILKTNDALSTRLYMFNNTATSLFYIYDESGVWASASWASSTSTWYTFNIVVRGNSIQIFDDNMDSILHAPLLTHANDTKLGLSYYPAPSDDRFDDLTVSV